MSEKLLGCPFCGGRAELLHGSPGCWFVRCQICAASSNDMAQDTSVAAWNTRASPQPEAGAGVTEEEIAETIWLSEYVRATGKRRTASWPDDLKLEDREKYLFVARAILAHIAQAGQSETVTAYAAWHPTHGFMMSSFADDAESSAEFAPADVIELGWSIVPVEIRLLPDDPEVDRG